MHVLLVNPWLCDFAAYDLWSKPLGLLQIAYRLRRAGADVVLLDCLDRFSPRLIDYLRGRYPERRYPRATPYGDGPYHTEIMETPPAYRGIPRRYKRYGMPVELFRQILGEQKKPDIILVTSGLTYWYPGVLLAIQLLKEEFRTTPLVLGGIYATLSEWHARSKSGADEVYAGASLKEILNLVSKLAGSSLQELPEDEAGDVGLFYAYELYPELRYITLRTSSGCPFRCSYCGWSLLSSDGKYRSIEPDRAAQVIEDAVRSFNVVNFAFYDEALLYRSQEHLLPLLEGILERGLKCNFHTPNALHARFLTRETARYMKKTGFVRPRLAMETVNPIRQRQTGGKVNEEQIKQAFSYLLQAEYAPREIGINVLIGMQNQPPAEVEASIKFVHSLGARIFLEEYAPVPGTPAYKESGLPPDIDPLYHNNSIFPLHGPERYAEFQRLKDLAHSLNREL